MEDAVNTEPGTAAGQADPGSAQQTTATAPNASEGQSAAGTTTGPQEDSFFDPKEVPAELLPAYKQMQGSYTKKMQALAEHREKVAAYDAFMSNPREQLLQMAEQYGLKIMPDGQTQPEPDDGQPQTWDEVYKRAEERAYARLQSELKPLVDQFRSMRATTIEKELDDLDPLWRDHEEAMKENLAKYPKLANDPAKLYKLSVPDELLMNRATQIALKKLEEKTKAGAMSGGSSTNKQPADDFAHSGPRSFADSVAAAKRKLESAGIRPQ